jgi:hypothetical protein
MQRRRVATAVLAAAGLLAACSAGGNAARTESEVPGGAPNATAPAGSGGGTGADGRGTGAAAGAGPGVIAGTTRAQLRASAIDDRAVPLRIDVARLRASGELVDLELTLTNEAPASSSKPLTFSPDQLFGDGGRYDMSGVGLVDPDHHKLYLPVLDSGNTCLCTGELGAADYSPGGTYTLAATYGGVPRDADRLDVRIPQFPAVLGVRIER